MNCKSSILTALFIFTNVFGGLPAINEWQFVDPKSNHVYPWYTKPFLDELSTWDIENWDVFEWGGGFSTIWFGHKCRKVVTVDDSSGWLANVQQELDSCGMDHVILKHRYGSYPFNIGEGGEDSKLVNAIDEDDALYDLIIIDSECHRNACALHVLDHIKDGGIVILDNANQASVGLNSEKTFELFKDYEHHSFLQPGHPDWRTDYWVIRKEKPDELSYEALAASEFTDHVIAFKKLFEAEKIETFLEFGLGLGTKFFLDNCEEVTSIELLVKDRHSFVVPWFCNTVERFEAYPNWKPSLHIFSNIVNAANDLAIQNIDPEEHQTEYLREINAFFDSVIDGRHYDLIFVDPGMHIRGDLVNLLFGRADIIAAHDTNFNSQCYGWYKLSPPDTYEEIVSKHGSGITFWVLKKKQALIHYLKSQL